MAHSGVGLELLNSDMLEFDDIQHILLTLVGPASVQRFNDALGAATVKVRRCLEDSKAYEHGLNNETDAEGMGATMEAVKAVYDTRAEQRGLRMVYEPKYLRFFQARFEPL